MFSNKTEQYKAEWQQLIQAGMKRKYKAGDVIYIQGGKEAGLVCITKGRVKNCIYFSNGSEKLICILEAPSITGETSIIDDKGSIVSTEALTDTEVFVVSTSTIKKMLEQNPRLMMFLLECNAEKMRALQFQAENIRLNTRQKLARLLINFQVSGVHTKGTETNVITMTHEQLADFLGTTRPKITEALNEFEKEGYIKKNRGSIKILKYDGLAAICR
ncbi:Crp/Fnr family transcriptional regulator [Lachnospiraceae bacterium 62-35]